MFGAPSIVSVMDLAAIIAALFIVQWLKEAVGGLSIPHQARGVKGAGLTSTIPTYPPSLPAGASGEVRECGTFHSRLHARSSLCYLGITCRNIWALTTSGIG